LSSCGPESERRNLNIRIIQKYNIKVNMKVAVYNQKGEKTEHSVILPKEIFEVPMNADLVHQVLTSQMANKRQVSAHTKSRAEVAGSGIKPWRQKGTGRARHGSRRSPIWVGGGITHGPRKDKVLERDIPKKMRRKALFMVLSEKAKQNLLIVLDKIELEKGKTKEMAGILKLLPNKDKSTIIALDNYDKKVFLAARNINKTKIDEARNLNVLNLMNSKYLLLTKESIKTIEGTFLK
jgi:large subunit ribosomal protein L4